MCSGSVILTVQANKTDMLQEVVEFVNMAHNIKRLKITTLFTHKSCIVFILIHFLEHVKSIIAQPFIMHFCSVKPYQWTVWIQFHFANTMPKPNFSFPGLP
jgi:hypothetical protein